MSLGICNPLWLYAKEFSRVMNEISASMGDKENSYVTPVQVVSHIYLLHIWTYAYISVYIGIYR